MNKILQNAGRTCSSLRKIFLKNKTQPRKLAYKKRRNYCVNFLQKKRKFSLKNWKLRTSQ